MNDPAAESLPIELVTESSWIFGRIGHDEVSNAPVLESALHLDGYGLSGRSLIESGRLVDVLNRGSTYLSLRGAWIQPHFPIELLDRTLDELAVNTGEILCAAPPQQAPGPDDGHRQMSGAREEAREPRMVELQIGPFLVRGVLHVLPGSDPVAFYFNSDKAFLPLTNASAVYLPERERQWQRDVLCVNVRRTQFMVATDMAAERGPIALLRRTEAPQESV